VNLKVMIPMGSASDREATRSESARPHGPQVPSKVPLASADPTPKRVCQLATAAGTGVVAVLVRGADMAAQISAHPSETLRDALRIKEDAGAAVGVGEVPLARPLGGV